MCCHVVEQELAGKKIQFCVKNTVTERKQQPLNGHMSDHLLVVRINALKLVTLNCSVYVFALLLVGFASIRV